MLTSVLTLTLAVVSAGPSASTMAAVAVFAANVDRQWPTDDREPTVTLEAFRLMTEAAKAMADDAKVNNGKLRDAITSLESAREALAKETPDARDRAKATRKALDEGRVMIDRLAAELKAEKRTTNERAALKKAADELDTNKPVPQQVDMLEKYFQQAAQLMKSLLEATT